MNTTKNVNIICSAASLLSGSRNLDDCISPDDDESCQAGIASVMAFARNFTNHNDYYDEPTVIVQTFDKNSPFVNMHPLQWAVNRLILNEIFGLNFFIIHRRSSLSLLFLQQQQQEEEEEKHDNTILVGRRRSTRTRSDVSDLLESFEFALLMSNVNVNPSNSWHPYMKSVHLDKETGLALISIIGDHAAGSGSSALFVDQVAASKGILGYLAQLNKQNGCQKGGDGEEVELSKYQAYLLENDIRSVPMTKMVKNESMPLFDGHDDHDDEGSEVEAVHCWVPVILYQDAVEANYWEFLNEITHHEHPPSLVINLERSYETHLEPVYFDNTTVWVAQCPMDNDNYCQHRVSLSSSSSSSQDERQQQQHQPRILNVDFINKDLGALPEELKDEAWDATIWQLRTLADEAQANNPTVGYTDLMPVSRDGAYRACQAGECPLGSLFTEALLWFTDSDVAFTGSGGYRGPGWPAGAVTLPDLYAGLPFPNSECTGVMSGLSLFKLLNYTTSVATFEGEQTVDGARLLQVAGMQVSYNTQLSGSRLVGVDIWNKTTASYEPIDGSKMYKFATDSFVCGSFDPYPDLTGGDFVIEGEEEPGVIGDNLVQNIAADYLTQFSMDSPWNTSYQGRLQNQTENFQLLNLIPNVPAPPSAVCALMSRRITSLLARRKKRCDV